MGQGGYLPEVKLPINDLSGGIIGSLNILTAAMLLVILLNNLQAAFKSGQEKQSQLTRNNQILEQLTTSLEATIAERTHLAETARAEAETAQQGMQAQYELTRALAEINECLRGEQDTILLAKNVLRQLCQSLEAQMGAMFVREGDQLNMIASYAYTRRKGLTNQFKLGEGLIGQAALEKETIILTQVPIDYVTLASGMLELVPRRIMALPFLRDNEVIGVIELATLGEFTPAQTALLDKALESIAIAFTTAQARTQINILLGQTQEQAEELRVREESLRAVNEELQAQAENLRDSQDRLRRQQTELESVNTELEERAAILQQQRTVLDEQNQDLKIAQEGTAAQSRRTNPGQQIQVRIPGQYVARTAHAAQQPADFGARCWPTMKAAT